MYREHTCTDESCIPCVAGKYSLGLSACVDCDAGRYGTYRGSSSSSACNTCSKGEYSGPGLAACVICPTGYYNGQTGQTACFAQNTCNAGKYFSGSSASAGSCAYCHSGKYQSSNGHRSGSCTAWRTCNAGMYFSGGSATSAGSCSGCWSGTYQSSNGHRSGSCYACPVGYYQNDGGQSDCGSCPDGKYTLSRSTMGSFGTLENLGGSGCTTSATCANCQGDCDSDRDCAGDLKCFQRSAGEAIPGCTDPGGQPRNYDYCYANTGNAYCVSW
jgi:hypothetical protein